MDDHTVSHDMTNTAVWNRATPASVSSSGGRHLTVMIVGGGPAGSTTAILLRRQGHIVTIIDRDEFPRDKTCGDAIVRKTASTLCQLDLAKVLVDRPLFSGDNYVIPRKEFDAALLQEARAAGTTVITGTVIDAEATATGGWRVHFRDKSSSPSALDADVLVGADGTQSTVQRAVLEWYKPLQGSNYAFAARQYFIASSVPDRLRVFPPLLGETLRAYGWMFPVSQDLVNIGYVRFGEGSNRMMLTNFNSFLERLFEEGMTRNWSASPIDQPRAGMIRYDFSSYRDSEVLLVGDAAGLSSPITGEGISFAVRSGALAADVISSYARGSMQLSDYWRLTDDTLGDEIRSELVSLASRN